MSSEVANSQVIVSPSQPAPSPISVSSATGPLPTESLTSRCPSSESVGTNEVLPSQIDPSVIEPPAGPSTEKLGVSERSIRSASTTSDSLQHTHALASQFQINAGTWTLALVTGLSLTLTIVYAWAVSVTSGPLTNLVPPSPSKSLNILRISSDVVGALLTALCTSTLEVMVWAAASSDKGITMSSFLGMSSSTGVLGLAYLLGWKGDSEARCHHRIWVGTRYHLSHN